MAQVVLRRKITFDMEIKNVKQLKRVYSETYVIRGLKWKFEIEKKIACQDDRIEDTIAVWLHCNIPNELKDYMCGAQAKVKLVSFKDKKESKQVCISEVYDSESNVWGHDDFIEWKKLFSDGYVRDDVIIFEMELQVGILENKDCNSLVIRTIEDNFEDEEETKKNNEINTEQNRR